MPIYEIKGNLLEADVDYICHQVNCQGVMGSGIAKSIKDKWPEVYEGYRSWYTFSEDEAINNSPPEWALSPGDIMLGHIQIINTKNYNIVNMAAQNYYGKDGKRYTSYDAFWMCLGEILNKIPKGSKLGFPKNIGCCRGGANWIVIKTMITEVLGEKYEVYIYELK